MSQQRWIGRWMERNGAERELLFISEASRAIARIDFRLTCLDKGIVPPQCYDLEEGTTLLARVDMSGKQPTLHG